MESRVIDSTLRVLLTLMIGSALLACGSPSFTPYAVSGAEANRLSIVGTCAGDDLAASVTETADEVRVSKIVGTTFDGDCAGVIMIELQEPLGDRRLVVNGKEWVELRPSCPFGTVGDPDLVKEFDADDNRCAPLP